MFVEPRRRLVDWVRGQLLGSPESVADGPDLRNVPPTERDEKGQFKNEWNRKALGSIEGNSEDFKGLESEVIVLVDMPGPGQRENLRSHHYVGMSRARALLSMICC